MDVTTNFPEEVIEMIFNQIKAKDLKKAMLVSPAWNEHIGNSARCMKKLNLVMTGDSTTFKDDAKQLLESQRKYPNISINDGDKHVNVIYDIIQQKHDFSQLKSVEIYNTKFATTLEFVELVKVFESSVEKLMLQGVSVEKTIKTPLNFQFSKLKNLTIMYCEETVFIDMFLPCANLESLTLGNSKVKPTDSAEIIETFRRNNKLKQLNLNAEIFSIIFSTDASEMSFNLVDFSITNFGININIEKTGENFKNFLQAQSRTIKKLHLGDFFGFEILKFAYQMKALKELKMFHLPVTSWEVIDLHSSATIEILDIITTDIRNKERIKCLLKSVPNVKRLRLRSIDIEMAMFIKKNLKKLQRIQMLNPLQGSLGCAKEILSTVKFT